MDQFGSDISSWVLMDLGWVEKNQVEEGWSRVGSDISSWVRRFQDWIGYIKLRKYGSIWVWYIKLSKDVSGLDWIYQVKEGWGPGRLLLNIKRIISYPSYPSYPFYPSIHPIHSIHLIHPIYPILPSSLSSPLFYPLPEQACLNSKVLL